MLCEIGYDMLMSQGTDLTDAMIRSNPMYSMSGGSSRDEILDAAERVNITQVFGCLSKHPFPIPNIMAACKYASQYTIQNAKGSVLILPHGVPDMLRYTRAENMQYEIAGPVITEKTKGKPINMTIEKAYADPSTDVKILIHRPMPNMDHGTAHPDVGPGGLQDDVRICQFYVLRGTGDKTFDELEEAGIGANNQIVNYETRSWAPMPVPKDLSLTKFFAQRAKASVSGEVAVFMEKVLNACVKPKTGENVKLAVDGDVLKFIKADGSAVDYADAGPKYEKHTDDDFQTQLKTLGDNILRSVATLIFQADIAKIQDYMKAIDNKDKLSSEIPKLLDTTAGGNAKFADANDSQNTIRVLAIRKIRATMSSAILAAPGADTGSLLVGYPFTSVSTSSQEIVKIQMRTYLGSVLKRPESVLIIRNIFFEGIKSGAKVPVQLESNATEDYMFVPIKKEFVDSNNTCIKFQDILDKKADHQLTIFYLALYGMVELDENGEFTLSAHDEDDGIGLPGRMYRGAQRVNNGTGVFTQDGPYGAVNSGHLGGLDDPSSCARLYGQFVYSSNPDPRSHH